VEIKILGTGCPNCRRLEALARSVAASVQPDAEFVDVTDIPEILSYGVMHTPALVIDGALRCSGRIPSKQEIAAWLTGSAADAAQSPATSTTTPVRFYHR
jgi:small redox-active disulfide protein 2